MADTALQAIPVASVAVAEGCDPPDNGGGRASSLAAMPPSVIRKHSSHSEFGLWPRFHFLTDAKTPHTAVISFRSGDVHKERILP